MATSTRSSGSTRPLRQWLRGEMEMRGWDQPRLAAELDMTKSTVGKWLLDDDNKYQRRPSYDACRRLARVFGVDLRSVLEMAGIDDFERERHLSDLQREVQATVALIPDPSLIVVRPMLQALIDDRIQHLVTDQLAAVARGETVSPTPTGRKGTPDRRRTPAPAEKVTT